MVAQPNISAPSSDLTSLPGYESLGAYLKLKQKQLGVTQADVAFYFPLYGPPTLSETTYGFLVRNRRALLPGEIVPLFTVFVKIHEDKHKPLIGREEAKTFFTLAQQKVKAKKKGAPKLSDEEWQEILQQVLLLADTKERILHLVQRPLSDLEPEDSRRRQLLSKLLDMNTSHLLEREAWLERVKTYPDRHPQIKVGVVQGAMGAGKSRALALLTQQLAERPDLFLIPYVFEHNETMTPDDHLDTFLATLLSDLTMKATEDTKQRPLDLRIKQVLSAIRALDQKVIILLDDAQELFPAANEWSVSWHEFFETWIDQPHTATLYVFTRIWPGWDRRERQFLAEDDLPDLSIEAGITIWKRLEFDDVEDELLRRVCERTGQNPQAIEMLAYQYRRRGFARHWGRGSVQTKAGKNPNTQSLEALLESETLFAGNLDKTSREALLQVFSNRLSEDTIHLLECLALSPLGIPFDLLFEQFSHADESFEHLVKASFADLSMAKTGRAAVVPLVREAVFQSLTASRKAEIEQVVTACYEHWLYNGMQFNTDAEKSALIAEMIVRYIKVGQLLKAAELIIQFGWLCVLFGQVIRIQRVFEEVMRTDKGKDLGDAYEAGRILLFYHLPTVTGEGIDPRARDTDFRRIHNFVHAGKVTLNPHSEVYLAYTLMIRMVQEKRYPEACRFLQDTMDRVVKTGGVTTEVRAAFWHNKAKLLGHWSSSAFEMHQTDEAFRLRSEYVAVLAEVVQLWRSCLANSLPIQEHYYHFKMARALNDLAYCYRIINRLDEAEEAIKECLYLKEEKKATLPRSRAVSRGEYAQILLAQGRYHQSDVQNAQALECIDQILQSGDSSACADKGMLLVERARIYQRQGRMDEARQFLEDALLLLNEDRTEFRFEAEQQLAHIEVLEGSSLRYQLDARWYPRYLPLASYDDLSWLAQAGPFTIDERRTWDQLYPRRRESEIWRQLAEMARQSKEREFEQSAREARLPQLLYPAIDIDDIHARIQGFTALKEAIEKEEENIVVSRLYIRKIEEHLITLRLVEATYKQDIDALRRHNEALYGKISREEMIIALRELFRMLMRAQNHPQAWEVAEPLLKQLHGWGLLAEDFLSSEEIGDQREVSQKMQQWRKTPVSSRSVQRLYEQVLKSYGFTEWRVVPSPDRDTISLDLDLCQLYLPTNNHFTALSVAEFLAEEIETHIFRSVAGKRSKIALLGSGTRGFLPTEEGLAALAIEEMMKAQALGPKLHSWVTTLSAGMATGVLTPAQSFAPLCAFFEQAFFANHLQYGRYEMVSEARGAARYDALVRVSRTFRGIPDLTATGVCNAKDRVYLQGYREVTDTLAHYPLERLLVGSIGTSDLSDMEDLHILEPVIKHQHLAHDPQLFERIIVSEK